MSEYDYKEAGLVAIIAEKQTPDKGFVTIRHDVLPAIIHALRMAEDAEKMRKWLEVLEINIRDGGCDVDSPLHKHLKKFLTTHADTIEKAEV